MPENLLRLSIPDSPETSKPRRVIGAVTLKRQTAVLLPGGWQGHWLLPESEDDKSKKRVRKVIVMLNSIELFAPS